jgi:hypothetical protein
LGDLDVVAPVLGHDCHSGGFDSTLVVALNNSTIVSSMASEYIASPVPEKFATALLSVPALADTLSRLNVDIDINSFIDEVNKASEDHAPPLTAVLSPEKVNNKRNKDVRKGEHISLCCGYLLSALVPPSHGGHLRLEQRRTPRSRSSGIRRIEDSRVVSFGCCP